MKLLLVANSDWFHHRFNRELCETLRREGHEVRLASPPGDYVEALQGAGFRWAGFPLRRRSVNPLRELRTLLALRRIYSRERPDLVHHFTLKCALYGSLAARLAGVGAVVSSITGLGYVYSSDEWRARVLRGLVDRLARPALRGTRVIFLNRGDRDELVRRRVVVEELSHLVPSSGVDTDRFRPLPEPEGEPLVALVARMLWDKGVADFVEAAAALARRGVRARFALVGGTDPGNPAAIPEARLREWESQGTVEWWGFREDMIAVYAAAAVVCLPTVYGEGVPTVLLEAAACGRPLVATDIAGCREIVRHEENGLLVPVRRPERLVMALERLLADRELRRTMGRKGRELVAAELSVERVVRATRAVYREASGR